MKQHLITASKGSLIALLLLNTLPSSAQEGIGLKSLEQVFALASIMTDSDALTFGIANFELKYLLVPEDPKWGNDKSVDFKKSIDIFVAPYQWQLDDIDQSIAQSFSVRGAYIEVQRDSEPLQGYTNFKNEQVFAAFAEYSQRYQLTEHWYGGLSVGAHLMYYRNKYNYSDGFPSDIRDALDGFIFNTGVSMAMMEPVFELGYQKQQSWGQWTIHNRSHYLFGQGIGGDAHNIGDVQPEGWRVTNGVKLKFSVPTLWGVSDHIAFDVKRVDIGGDMSNLSDDGYYYETSVGWVIDTKDNIPFLDNVGIGININYGSTISGGTLVLYYNE